MARRPSPQGKKAAARLAVPTVMQSEGPRNRTEAAIERLQGVERLDTSRAYGKVSGDFIVSGVRVAYEQGTGRGRPSKLYDHQFRRIYRDGEKAAAPKEPRVREVEVQRQSAPPPPPVDTDENDDLEEDLPPMTEPTAPEAGDDDDVNLVAWGQRIVTYRWAAIRDAIEARYGRVVNDEAEARDFLQTEGIGDGSGRKAQVHGG